MKNNKGISMVTLIITIVCIIIFVGIAYRIGTRYISESIEEEKNALVSIMSDVVERRQNDKYVGVGGQEIYYSGYHIPEENFINISQYFDTNDFIYEPGLWFLIDAKGAGDLGVKNPEKYLVTDLTDKNNIEGKYVGVADYYTGKVFLIPFMDMQVNVDDFKQDGCTHEGSINFATCIDEAVCSKCNTVISQALGHDYGAMTESSCTDDLTCSRCGYIAEKAIGHTYGTELKHNDDGHYNECINIRNGVTCGAIGNFQEHSKVYSMTADEDYWYHNVRCEDKNGNRLCNYEKTEECTKDIKPYDVRKHIEHCIYCLKAKEVSHDVEKQYKYTDNDNHMVYCGSCKSDLYEEEHVDIEATYGKCDKCDGIVNMDKVPEVLELTMENITSGQEKYWAKKNEEINVMIRVNCVLSEAPVVKVQNEIIKPNSITPQDSLTWIAIFNTSDYNFVDGQMMVEISGLRSIWGIEGITRVGTTDDKYITYDATIPEYIFIPE